MKTWNNLPSLKHILALTTWGQKCIVTMLQPFTFDRILTEHPVFIVATSSTVISYYISQRHVIRIQTASSSVKIRPPSMMTLRIRIQDLDTYVRIVCKIHTCTQEKVVRCRVFEIFWNLQSLWHYWGTHQ